MGKTKVDPVISKKLRVESKWMRLGGTESLEMITLTAQCANCKAVYEGELSEVERSMSKHVCDVITK